jgi:hypothetical protein
VVLCPDKIVFPISVTLVVWKEVPRCRRNRCRDLFLQLLKEFEEFKLWEPSKHLQILACRSSRIWIGQRDLTDVRGRYCGIGHPLASGQTTLDIVEGGMPSTDTLTVCPLGDTTSRSQDRPGHHLLHSGRKERSRLSRPGLSPPPSLDDDPCLCPCDPSCV